MENKRIVLRKKRLGGREKTASVNTIEGWYKKKGEKTGEDSREGMDAERERNGLLKRGKNAKIADKRKRGRKISLKK